MDSARTFREVSYISRVAIIAEMKGGLGNQLFIWAGGLAVATRLGVPLLADVSSFEDDRFGRSLELESFAHGIAEFQKISSVPAGWCEWKESQFAYIQNFERIQDRTYLRGHFQSWKYFWPIKKVVTQRLLDSTAPSKGFLAAQTFLQSVGAAVHVHVRLGDYKHLKNLGTLREEYYSQALRHVQSFGNRLPIVLFSDEPNEAFELIPKRSRKVTFLVENDGSMSPYEVLRLMASTKRLIMANSSFSWWAGFLVRSTGGQVLAPRTWMRDSYFDTSDLFLESTKLIKNRFLSKG